MNFQLKNKLTVLRNQLLSHTMSGVSPTRSRRPHTRPSSGLMCVESVNRLNSFIMIHSV